MMWGFGWGLSFCLFAYVFYLKSQSNLKEAEFLESAIKINNFKDLEQLLDTASGLRSSVVTMRASVHSETLIAYEHSGLRSVIVQEQVPRLERGDSVLLTETLLTLVGEAVKDNIGTIQIQKPRDGPFYMSRRSIDGLVEDQRTLARFHKYVCVGFIVVGGCLIAMNAINYIRKMVSRRRVSGAVSPLEQHNEGNWCIVTVSEVSYENVGSRTTARNRENISNIHRLMPDSPRLLENVGSDRAALSGEDNSSRGHLLADDSNLCVICLQHEYNTVFVPCGHLCCCMTCSSYMKSCPLCRRRISHVVRTFRP